MIDVKYCYMKDVYKKEISNIKEAKFTNDIDFHKRKVNDLEYRDPDSCSKKLVSDIIELYFAADAFFMSSLSDPSPLTCVEALWCGKSLFVSEYVGNYPEVIKQGENGYMYRYSDEQEAVKLLDAFVSASDDWKKKASEISLQIASERFDLEQVTRRLLTEMHYISC